MDNQWIWGAVLAAYTVFWAVWARYDLMLSKPDNPPLLEKEKWDAIEARFNKRSIQWFVGFAAFLFVWAYFTDRL